MSRRRVVLAWLLVLCFAAMVWLAGDSRWFRASSRQTSRWAESHTPITVTRNLSYPAGDGTSQQYDLYAPATSPLGHLPMLVWLHGGGWSIGDKSDWLSQAVSRDAAGLGFVVFDVNYRLNTADRPARFPAASDDIAAFIRFLLADPRFANVGAAPLSIGGHSAGGQLALFAATDARLPERFRCVVDLAGVTDLTAADLPSGLVPFITALAPTPDERIAASALRHVASWHAERALLLHATDDATVPVAQSQAMVAALAGAPQAPRIVQAYPAAGGHDLSVAIIAQFLDDTLAHNCA